jgi:hypothetical protein
MDELLKFCRPTREPREYYRMLGLPRECPGWLSMSKRRHPRLQAILNEDRLDLDKVTAVIEVK